jgi:hypothetical protein
MKKKYSVFEQSLHIRIIEDTKILKINCLVAGSLHYILSQKIKLKNSSALVVGRLFNRANSKIFAIDFIQLSDY